MFGYVSVDKPEMKIKDFATFRAYYCGLCKAMGRELSQAGRFGMSYDCAFLYLLLASTSDRKPEYRRERCPASPFAKKTFAVDDGAEYAAAVNVLLSVSSLRDHAQDDHSIPARIGVATLKSAYRRATEMDRDLAQLIQIHLDELAELERNRERDLDRVSHVFADMLGEVFCQHDKRHTVLYKLGYYLGRWIYLIDAYDDLEKDLEKGAYNPFAEKYHMERNGKCSDIYEEAKFLLNSSLAGVVQAYELLDIKKHKGILDNVIYLGLYQKTGYVLDGEKKSGKKE